MTATLPNLLAMHAPDRLFSMPVNLACAAVVAALLTIAVRRIAARPDHRAAPLMGIVAAFVFAAQMLNFPVAAGTTGHLLGGTLAGILLGPWAGTVAMVAVISVQAIVFQDGGITTLGPNIFNMGILGTLGGYCIHRAVVRGMGGMGRSSARVVGAAFFAAWQVVVVAAVCVSVELAVSGTVPLHRALPAMLYVHMIIGVGEGLITAAVVAFVLRTRPELLFDGGAGASSVGRPVLATGFGIALAFGAGLSLLPALWDDPDGLESVASKAGFLVDDPPPFEVLPDYKVPGVHGLASASLAGGIGTLLMFALSFVVGKVLVRPAVRSRPCTSAREP